MNAKKIIGAIAAIAAITLILHACLPEPQQPTGQANETQNTTQKSRDTTAELGDLIEIDFTLKLINGTIVDTTDAALAKESKLDKYKKGSQKLILGQSGKVKGFDDAIAGLQLGETATKIIPPSEPEYLMKINKTKTVHRFQPINRKQAFGKSGFKDIFGKPPAVGDLVYNFERFPWTYQIVEIKDEHVIAQINTKEGDRYQLPSLPWNSTVFAVYTDVITFYHNPKDGQIIETEYGKANITTTGKTIYVNQMPKKGTIISKSIGIGGIGFNQDFKIVEVTDKKFVIQKWGMLEDKTLELTVTLKNITKDVKQVKPSRIKGKLVPVSD